MIKKLLEINYQRNGVGGEGFFQLLATGRNKENYLITFVYDCEKTENNINTESCRVVNTSNFSLAYRGDEFARELNNLLFSSEIFKNYFTQRLLHFNLSTNKPISS